MDLCQFIAIFKDYEWFDIKTEVDLYELFFMCHIFIYTVLMLKFYGNNFFKIIEFFFTVDISFDVQHSFQFKMNFSNGVYLFM